MAWATWLAGMGPVYSCGTAPEWDRTSPSGHQNFVLNYRPRPLVCQAVGFLVVTAMTVVVCSHPTSRGALPSRGGVKRGKSGVRPALSRSCHRRPSAAEARMPASATMPSTFARKGAGSPSQMARVVPCRFRGQGFFFVNDPALKGEA